MVVKLKHQAFESSSGLTRGSITRMKRYEMGCTVKPCNDSAQRILRSAFGHLLTKAKRPRWGEFKPLTFQSKRLKGRLARLHSWLYRKVKGFINAVLRLEEIHRYYHGLAKLFVGQGFLNLRTIQRRLSALPFDRRTWPKINEPCHV